MWTSLRRVPAFVLTSMLLTAMAYAGDDGGQGPSARGPIFDITHFDVLPVNTDTPDSFEQAAYTALFAYRNASETDPGSKSFRVVNWLAAPNHSQIIDVWSSLDAFEAHLAQPHSTDFRFAVQLPPPLAPPFFNCCIGSPIDDRQYPGKALRELIRYGSDTSQAAGQLSYTVLQQIDRPNRFATLEVWDSLTDYNNWQTDQHTTQFVTKVMPLLGSPFDHRLNRLCGETYVDNTGCTPAP